MTLLKELQQLLERTYEQTTGVNLEEFVIGRQRFQHLSAMAQPEVQELSETARFFMRKVQDRLLLAIYYSDWLVDALEQNDPRRGVSDRNVYPFLVFIEELNHAVHAALKFIEGHRNISDEAFLKDLELQGKIDTYLVLSFFVAYFNRTKRLEGFDRLWLRHHLFERESFDYTLPTLRQRYVEANQLGEKFTRFLDGLAPQHRIEELRHLRRLDYPTKARYIRMLP
jgi:hypothetical protein